MNSKLLAFLRSTFNTANNGRNTYIVAHAAVTVAGAAVGLSPVLLAFGCVAAVAGQIRERWGVYKEEALQQKVTQNDLIESFKEMREPTSSDSISKKASSYSNFLETFKTYTSNPANVGMYAVNMLSALNGNLNLARQMAESEHENIQPLLDVQAEMHRIGDSMVLKVATANFLNAIEKPAAKDLFEIAYNLVDIRVAAESNNALLGFNPRGDTEENKRVCQWRLNHLKSRFQQEKETIESDLVINENDSDKVQMIKIKILKEMPNIAEKIDQTTRFIAEKDRTTLYAAWNTMHESNKDDQTLESKVFKMEAFQECLVQFSKQNLIMSDPIMFADRLNDRAVLYQSEPSADTTIGLRLEKVKEFSIAFIKTHVANAAEACIRDMYREGPVEQDYTQLMSNILLVRDAAQVLAISEKFSPDSIQGPMQVAKITARFDHIKSTLALGIDESTEKTNEYRSMQEEITIAAQAVKAMQINPHKHATTPEIITDQLVLA